MKILVVSAFSLRLNTSGTLQNLIMIEGLKKLGYQVDVVTTEIAKSHVSYDETLSLENVTNYYEIKLPDVYTAMRTSKNQKRLVASAKKILKKIYNEIEMYDGYKSAINNLDTLQLKETDYDYIISTSDPKSSHLIARAVIKKYNMKHIPWIQYWGDPLYLDITRKRKSIFDNRVKKAELELIEDASRVVYATPFTARQQKSLYPRCADQMDYATQGYWKDYLNLPNSKNSVYTIGYFGNYNPTCRNILPLYDAVSDMDGVHLNIGGAGMALESSENISILGFLNHGQIKEYEQQADTLICLLNSRGTQIPGKLYYYASFNKPLLVILDGELGEEMESFLKGFGRYHFCKNDAESIKNAIIALRDTSAQETNEISRLLTPKYMAQRILYGGCLEDE